MRDCFIVSRNASPGQRRWECSNMRMFADPVLGWEGEMGPVNKFFNTGQICTKQVTSLESWILSEGRPAMGISFPLDISLL